MVVSPTNHYPTKPHFFVVSGLQGLTGRISKPLTGRHQMKLDAIEVVDENGVHCYVTQECDDLAQDTNLGRVNMGKFDIEQVAAILPTLGFELAQVIMVS